MNSCNRRAPKPLPPYGGSRKETVQHFEQTPSRQHDNAPVLPARMGSSRSTSRMGLSSSVAPRGGSTGIDFDSLTPKPSILPVSAAGIPPKASAAAADLLNLPPPQGGAEEEDDAVEPISLRLDGGGTRSMSSRLLFMTWDGLQMCSRSQVLKGCTGTSVRGDATTVFELLVHHHCYSPHLTVYSLPLRLPAEVNVYQLPVSRNHKAASGGGCALRTAPWPSRSLDSQLQGHILSTPPQELLGVPSDAVHLDDHILALQFLPVLGSLVPIAGEAAINCTDQDASVIGGLRDDHAKTVKACRPLKNHRVILVLLQAS
eukprot:TRINITY_DN9324_c0_g1_i2.p1 TRINITY_DN9324_c0_g1~~TRINITY_DN9324_c0_g1_i2.p1  ORF type:complete len:316 (+),score=26.66 TRINITY_DN9324_c0_g1_i2:174-1121(+)